MVAASCVEIMRSGLVVCRRYTSVLWLGISQRATLQVFLSCRCTGEGWVASPARTATMQVLLRRSEFRQDIRCSVCGEGFRLSWELNSPSERAPMRSIVLGELRDHHSREQGGDKTSAAHPFDLFRLPGWTGSPKFARETLLAGPSRPPSDISKVVMISSRQPK